MDYKYKTLTNDGASLMAQDDSNQTATIVDKMIFSNQQIDPNSMADLHYSDINAPLQFPVTIMKHNGNTFQPECTINNDNVTQDYSLNIVGVCGHPANDENTDDETLIGIAYTDDPLVLPAKSNTEFKLWFAGGFTYSNAQNVQANVTDAGTINDDDLNNALSSYATTDELSSAADSISNDAGNNSDVNSSLSSIASQASSANNNIDALLSSDNNENEILESFEQNLINDDNFSRSLAGNSEFAAELSENYNFGEDLASDDVFTDSLASNEDFIDDVTENDSFVNPILDSCASELPDSSGFVSNLTENENFIQDMRIRTGVATASVNTSSLASDPTFINDLADNHNLVNEIAQSTDMSSLVYGNGSNGMVPDDITAPITYINNDVSSGEFPENASHFNGIAIMAQGYIILAGQITSATHNNGAYGLWVQDVDSPTMWHEILTNN